MRFHIQLGTSGSLTIEADYFEIEDDGTLILRGHTPTRKVAAVAGGAWSTVRALAENEVAA